VTLQGCRQGDSGMWQTRTPTRTPTRARALCLRWHALAGAVALSLLAPALGGRFLSGETWDWHVGRRLKPTDSGCAGRDDTYGNQGCHCLGRLNEDGVTVAYNGYLYATVDFFAPDAKAGETYDHDRTRRTASAQAGAYYENDHVAGSCYDLPKGWSICDARVHQCFVIPTTWQFGTNYLMFIDSNGAYYSASSGGQALAGIASTVPACTNGQVGTGAHNVRLLIARAYTSPNTPPKTTFGTAGYVLPDRMTVLYNGRFYRTISGAGPEQRQTDDTIEDGTVAITPPAGWGVATNDLDSKAVADAWMWGTGAVVVEGGVAHYTAHISSSGSLSATDGLITEGSAYRAKAIAEGADAQGLRVLISRPMCTGGRTSCGKFGIVPRSEKDKVLYQGRLYESKDGAHPYLADGMYPATGYFRAPVSTTGSCTIASTGDQSRCISFGDGFSGYWDQPAVAVATSWEWATSVVQLSGNNIASAYSATPADYSNPLATGQQTSLYGSNLACDNPPNTYGYNDYYVPSSCPARVVGASMACTYIYGCHVKGMLHENGFEVVHGGYFVRTLDAAPPFVRHENWNYGKPNNGNYLYGQAEELFVTNGYSVVTNWMNTVHAATRAVRDVAAHWEFGTRYLSDAIGNLIYTTWQGSQYPGNHWSAYSPSSVNGGYKPGYLYSRIPIYTSACTYSTAEFPCHGVGTMEENGAIVTYKGYAYRVLDGTKAYLRAGSRREGVGCKECHISVRLGHATTMGLPSADASFPQGWSLAPAGDADVIAIAKHYEWGCVGLVLADGTALQTTGGSSPGAVVSGTFLANTADGGYYLVGINTYRILIRSGPNAVCTGHQSTCQTVGIRMQDGVSVLYRNKVYRTLDSVPPDVKWGEFQSSDAWEVQSNAAYINTANERCQFGCVQAPSATNGYSNKYFGLSANPDDDTLAVISSWEWGAKMIVLEDGKAYHTAYSTVPSTLGSPAADTTTTIFPTTSGCSTYQVKDTTCVGYRFLGSKSVYSSTLACSRGSLCAVGALSSDATSLTYKGIRYATIDGTSPAILHSRSDPKRPVGVHRRKTLGCWAMPAGYSLAALTADSHEAVTSWDWGTSFVVLATGPSNGHLYYAGYSTSTYGSQTASYTLNVGSGDCPTAGEVGLQKTMSTSYEARIVISKSACTGARSDCQTVGVLRDNRVDVLHNGVLYRTIEGAPAHYEEGEWLDPPPGATSSCTQSCVALPDGWALTAPSADSIAVAKSWEWGTQEAIFSDGSVYTTAYSNGDVTLGSPTRTGGLHSASCPSGQYKAETCSGRIIISRSICTGARASCGTVGTIMDDGITIYLNGNLYMTNDQVKPDYPDGTFETHMLFQSSSNSSCHGSPISTTAGQNQGLGAWAGLGWQVAPPTHDVIGIIKSWEFSTKLMVLNDGSAYDTAYHANDAVLGSPAVASGAMGGSSDSPFALVCGRVLLMMPLSNPSSNYPNYQCGPSRRYCNNVGVLQPGLTTVRWNGFNYKTIDQAPAMYRINTWFSAPSNTSPKGHTAGNLGAANCIAMPTGHELAYGDEAVLVAKSWNWATNYVAIDTTTWGSASMSSSYETHHYHQPVTSNTLYTSCPTNSYICTMDSCRVLIREPACTGRRSDCMGVGKLTPDGISVRYNGKRYRTLDSAPPSSKLGTWTNTGSNADACAALPAGYVIAARDVDTKRVISAWEFATNELVMADGSRVATAVSSASAIEGYKDNNKWKVAIGSNLLATCATDTYQVDNVDGVPRRLLLSTVACTGGDAATCHTKGEINDDGVEILYKGYYWRALDGAPPDLRSGEWASGHGINGPESLGPGASSTGQHLACASLSSPNQGIYGLYTIQGGSSDATYADAVELIKSWEWSTQAMVLSDGQALGTAFHATPGAEVTTGALSEFSDPILGTCYKTTADNMRILVKRPACTGGTTTCRTVGATDDSGTVVSYNGKFYRALDGAPASYRVNSWGGADHTTVHQTGVRSNGQYYSSNPICINVPPGYQLATNTADALAVIASWEFSTQHMIVGDSANISGSQVYYTANSPASSPTATPVRADALHPYCEYGHYAPFPTLGSSYRILVVRDNTGPVSGAIYGDGGYPFALDALGTTVMVDNYQYRTIDLADATLPENSGAPTIGGQTNATCQYGCMYLPSSSGYTAYSLVDMKTDNATEATRVATAFTWAARSVGFGTNAAWSVSFSTNYYDDSSSPGSFNYHVPIADNILDDSGYCAAGAYVVSSCAKASRILVKKRVCGTSPSSSPSRNCGKFGKLSPYGTSVIYNGYEYRTLDGCRPDAARGEWTTPPTGSTSTGTTVNSCFLLPAGYEIPNTTHVALDPYLHDTLKSVASSWPWGTDYLFSGTGYMYYTGYHASWSMSSWQTSYVTNVGCASTSHYQHTYSGYSGRMLIRKQFTCTGGKASCNTIGAIEPDETSIYLTGYLWRTIDYAPPKATIGAWTPLVANTTNTCQNECLQIPPGYQIAPRPDVDGGSFQETIDVMKAWEFATSAFVLSNGDVYGSAFYNVDPVEGSPLATNKLNTADCPSGYAKVADCAIPARILVYGAAAAAADGLPIFRGKGSASGSGASTSSAAAVDVPSTSGPPKDPRSSEWSDDEDVRVDTRDQDFYTSGGNRANSPDNVHRDVKDKEEARAEMKRLEEADAAAASTSSGSSALPVGCNHRAPRKCNCPLRASPSRMNGSWS